MPRKKGWIVLSKEGKPFDTLHNSREDAEYYEGPFMRGERVVPAVLTWGAGGGKEE